MMELTRRYRFCASHRLHSAALDEERNRELYGKCNNPYGHGHNYVLEVTVAGEIGEDGRVVDQLALDALVAEQVVEPIDHRNLNLDVTEFSALVPTTENLALVIARRLELGWPGRFPQSGPKLARIRLEETGNNFFELNLRAI